MKVDSTKWRLIKEVIKFEYEQETPITWKDLKSFPLEDDWEIQVESDCEDPVSFYVIATTQERESDEEYAERMAKIEEIKQNTLQLHKQQRYERYLELKKEFEEDASINL